jgi:hypothetical protein
VFDIGQPGLSPHPIATGTDPLYTSAITMIWPRSVSAAEGSWLRPREAVQSRGAALRDMIMARDTGRRHDLVVGASCRAARAGAVAAQHLREVQPPSSTRSPQPRSGPGVAEMVAEPVLMEAIQHWRQWRAVIWRISVYIQGAD